MYVFQLTYLKIQLNPYPFVADGAKPESRLFVMQWCFPVLLAEPGMFQVS